MLPRALWVATLFGAALADAAGDPQVAFYLMLVAVSIGGVAALGALGELVDARSERAPEARAAVRFLLMVAGLVFTLAGPALRGPFVVEGTVPAVATSALVAALIMIVLELAVSAAPVRQRVAEAPRARRRPRREAETQAELKRAA